MAVRGDLESGSIVGGYRIDELISRGGMGVVYRATNVALNRIYALKVLAPELAEDPAFRERFKREMRIAASLHHPNVVGIHNAGDHDGMLFFVMDFVTGTDLRELLLKAGALEPHRAVDLLQPEREPDYDVCGAAVIDLTNGVPSDPTQNHLAGGNYGVVDDQSELNGHAPGAAGPELRSIPAADRLGDCRPACDSAGR